MLTRPVPTAGAGLGTERGVGLFTGPVPFTVLSPKSLLTFLVKLGLTSEEVTPKERARQ